MIENNYLIDWLSFTIQSDINGIGKSAVKGFLEKMGLDNLPFLEKETGRHGYNRSMSIQNYINIYYNEVKFNEFDEENAEKLDRIVKMGVHFEFSGQGCRILEQEKNWMDWFKILDNMNVRYSRLDIALDDFIGLLDFDVMEEKIKKGEVISLSRTRNIDSSLDFKKAEKLDNNGNSKGKTIYFGNRQSLMMIRFYDKKKEQEEKKLFCSYDFWQRYEIVLKREKATDFINKLKTGVDFAELYLKVLAGLIRFVDRGSDKNKARWKTSEFWNTFIKNSEGVKLKSKNLDPSLDKTIKWIDESVLTSLQLLSEVAKLGNLDFLEILKTSRAREKSDRQKSMLNEFNLLNEEQKQEIFNKIKELAV
jgi:phage replication initiation protein